MGRKIFNFRIWSTLFAALFFFFLAKYALTISLPTNKEPVKFYSNQTRDDLKQLICQAIDKSKSSLHLASYHLSDPEIIAKLNSCAPYRRISLYLDISNKRLKSKLDPKIILHLIKSKGLMHEKILVIDQKISFLGSANMTEDSLTHHDNLLMGVKSGLFAQKLIAHLHHLAAGEPSEWIAVRLHDQTIEMGFTPYHGPELLQKVVTTVEDSKRELFLSIFTLTHPKLISALAKAPNSKIILDRYAARGSSKKAASSLPSLRTHRGQALFHHKWALIDDHILILGSANWTRGAFQKNADYVLWFNPLNTKNKKFFNTIKKRSILESIQLQDN